MQYIIGIDIGGTHIDMVAINKDGEILKAHKQVHQKPLNRSIILAIQKLITKDFKPKDCVGIHIGTTIAINSLLEASGLKKVGILRLAAHQPEIPPAIHFPPKIREKIFAGLVNIQAGYEYDQRPMGEIHKEEVLKALEYLVQEGAQAFAVVGCFSPIYAQQEQEVLKIIESSAYRHLFTSLSHQLGGLGFLNRENNTLLNTGLHQVLLDELMDLKNALLNIGLDAPLHITQNNGCLMSLEEALQFPIKTIASGPINSLIGACKLAKLKNAVVVDIGGTSTDIGVIENGFPRYAFESASIADIATDYLLPDIQVIALGGGSLIQFKEKNYQIGPESLGSQLFEKALSFGGNQLCLHDVSHILKTQHPLPEIDLTQSMQIMQKVLDLIQSHIEKIPQIKDYPILMVGGGAGLLPEITMQRPKHYAIANAYGAALAEISATVDEIFELEHQKDEIIQTLENKAMQKAIQAGARADSVRVIQKELLPFYYMQNQLTRIVITASGTKSFHHEKACISD